jgi:hypothetical protein
MSIQQVVSVCLKLRAKIVEGSPIPPISNELGIRSPQNDVAYGACPGTRRLAEDNEKNGVSRHRGWMGRGVLTYKGGDYPFNCTAGGTFRKVDTEMTPVDLCGQVLNLL